MDIINRAFQDLLTTKRSATAGTSVRTGSGFFDMFVGGKGTGAVNYRTALKLPAFYNGVDQIGNALGIIPFHAYRRIDAGRERAADHPVDRLLSREPDGSAGYLTPFIFKKITQTSVLLRGNCLWRIFSDGAGRQRLKFIPWEEVSDIKKFDNPADGTRTLVYMTQKDGALLSTEVLHFKGFSYDGICGVSVIQHACLQLGVALEIQAFSYTNFESKGVRQGVIETAAKSVDVEAKKKIIAGYKAAMAEKSPDRVVVLDEGMSFKPITVTAQEAQVIESARFSIEDIARWLNIPLPKIKALSQSTNNNVEQQSLDFSTDTMQPHVTNFEEELTKKLFTPAEQEEMYVKGNMNVLLRSDLKAKGEYYSKMVNGGIYKANEVRAFEEMNAEDGGNELRIPVNTQTQSQIDNANNNDNE
jgi:HK97 family phage portal protein